MVYCLLPSPLKHFFWQKARIPTICLTLIPAYETLETNFMCTLQTRFHFSPEVNLGDLTQKVSSFFSKKRNANINKTNQFWPVRTSIIRLSLLFTCTEHMIDQYTMY